MKKCPCGNNERFVDIKIVSGGDLLGYLCLSCGEEQYICEELNQHMKEVNRKINDMHQSLNQSNLTKVY